MRRVYIKGLVISYRSLVTLHWKNQSREIELYGQGFTPLSPGVVCAKVLMTNYGAVHT